MSKTLKTVTTIGTFAEWVEQVSKLGTQSEREVMWFRGVGKSTYKLLPGLYRLAGGLSRDSDDELRVEFSCRAAPLVAGRTPRDKWEWYCLMQHYRVPTRFLDWTDAALVALYFALTAWRADAAGGRSQRRPAVWAMNPTTMNRRTDWIGTINTFHKDAQAYLPDKVYEGSRLPKLPIAIDPPLTAQRMLVQHSHFTIHGSNSRGLEEMEELFGGGGLTKVIIDLDETGLAYMKEHLAVMGVSQTTIYPDLEGLAEELRQEYQLF
jgi:hypothetical protein